MAAVSSQSMLFFCESSIGTLIILLGKFLKKSGEGYADSNAIGTAGWRAF
jgi:hypothetical protein